VHFRLDEDYHHQDDDSHWDPDKEQESWDDRVLSASFDSFKPSILGYDYDGTAHRYDPPSDDHLEAHGRGHPLAILHRFQDSDVAVDHDAQESKVGTYETQEASGESYGAYVTILGHGPSVLRPHLELDDIGADDAT